MRPTLLITLAPLLLATLSTAFPDSRAEPNADLIAEEDALKELQAKSLQSRGTCKEDGCKCRSGTKQGQYCYRCAAVNYYAKGSLDNVHECSPSGKCCNYGYSKTCHDGKQKCNGKDCELSMFR
ncbi:hypothetical protein LTS18_009279 [Coniosporium uncinatum]|uniref:Uncharacterized protein n=1 Tax=Coniosporium uncinatum TaxID=93489 RepID=A0ACC3DDG3_9PEZI|nr:hypothetical protein LTS18_009279 [Coniosporium uncinatum]